MNYIKNENMLPLEFIEIKRNKPLLVELEDGEGKLYYKCHLMTLHDYLDFATRCAPFAELVKNETTAGILAAYKYMVEAIISLAEYSDKIYERRLRNLLMREVETAAELYAKIIEYNTAVKKNIARAMEAISRSMGGETSSCSLKFQGGEIVPRYLI